MRNLRLYAFSFTQGLEFLGAGGTNWHYRIGKIGDVWLATREAWQAIGATEIQREVCEIYIDDLVSESEDGKLVPKIVGAVKAISGDKESSTYFERYFLLTENLTAGGTADFKPGGRASRSGTVYGRVVYYDFPEGSTKSFQYTTDDKVILLRNQKLS